ncbi:MAG: YlbF family regulator [Lachnospiraceae bacterium]|nr:YlbF family regulator [Lachnospiraceae bacterium]
MDQTKSAFEQIKPTLDQIMNSIKEIDVCKNFEHQKQLLDRDPKLKERVDDWRMRYYHFMQVADADQIYEASDRMAKEWEDICSDQVAFDFLVAEHEYYKFIQELREYLMESLFSDYE